MSDRIQKTVEKKELRNQAALAVIEGVFNKTKEKFNTKGHFSSVVFETNFIEQFIINMELENIFPRLDHLEPNIG